MTDYPPEPWYLGGSLLVSAFVVPLSDLPDIGDVKPIRLGRGALVGTAFARYVAGGVLSYDELLVAVPSRLGSRITIPQIWVDSPTSLAGGRELWAIPKELGTFFRSETTDTASVKLESVARLDARYGRRLLPGMTQLPLTTLQPTAAGDVVSRNRAIGRVSSLRASWTFDPDGPLSYLAGRRPFFSAAIRDASIIFGMDVQRP